MAKQLPKDAEWLRRSFMVPIKTATHQYELRRITNGAAFKFTDTTPGGNFAINPPPQFTSLADRPTQGLHIPSGRFGDGMGRFYSEAFDDNSTLVHMRFGVPQFNSLGNFITNAYNHETAIMARTGRASSGFYRAGQALGFVITLPFQAILFAGHVVRFMMGKPASRFYYMKPAMPLYWAAVTSMVNAIGVNMGQIGRAMSDTEAELRSDEENFSASDMTSFHELLPEIYSTQGGIDVFAMSTRAQRLAHQYRKQLEGVFENANSTEDLAGKLTSFYQNTGLSDSGGRSLSEAINDYHELLSNEWDGRLEPEDDDDKSRTDAELVGTGNEFEQSVAGPGWKEYATAELEDGAAFVTFRVDDPGPVSESFSNSVEESELANKINSMSSSARSTRFSLAEGNLSDGVIASTVGGIIGGVKNFLQGAAASVGMQGLNLLAGSAFVDIPKVWSGSTANLPSASYTIELRSPYGNPMSRLQNLYIPLAMILAGALPLSTGKQSYTSPFLCELYSKGRNQIRLGMIDSLTITRGTGNLGFNRQKEPLAIDVTFSVVDLSTVLHMPVNSSLKIGNIVKDLVGNFDDDNAFTDYMAVLGSLSLADQIYPTNKIRIRRARGMANWEQWKSPAYHSNWMMGTAPGRLLSAMTHTTNRGG